MSSDSRIGEALDPAAHGAGAHGHHGGVARVDAAGVERGAAAQARLADALGGLLAVAVAGEHVHGRHHVAAGLEDALEVVEVGPVGHVRHAVGLQRQQRLDVVGGDHADGVDAAQLTDVAPDLVVGVGEAADEVDDGVVDHAPHRGAAGLAGGPLHDLQAAAHLAIRSGACDEVSWSWRHTRVASLRGQREAAVGHERVVGVGVGHRAGAEAVERRGGDLLRACSGA